MTVGGVMLRDTTNAFSDELSKIAKITAESNQRKAPMMRSIAEVKKKLRPGDIILTKPSEGKGGRVSGIVRFFQKARGSSNPHWTHSSMYMGNNRVLHTFGKLKGDVPQRAESKVREHSLKHLADRLGRDVLVLRTPVSDEEASAAVRRAKRLLGRPYDTLSAIRSGVWSKDKRPGEAIEAPAKATCTTLLGYSYPQLEFSKKKSIFTLLPSDFAESKDLDHIAVYSRDS
jgi:uncharacterized protein YycO